MKPFILGIDQGGTHTQAAVCDLQGNILGTGMAFGACHSMDGMDKAMQAVLLACQRALAQAGVQSDQLELILGGLTGADWADEYPLLETNVQALRLCDRVRITNDTIIALRGGTEKSYGVILIAGSGGNCAVRSPDGREFIYGYFQEDDLQGGGALARHALVAIYRAHTGRAPVTQLTSRVLELYHLASVDELLRADVENRLPGEVFIAPVIFDEALHENQVAMDILRSLGKGYAELAIAGLHQLEMTELEVEVVLSGGIFKGRGTLLTDTIVREIRQVVPKAVLVNARYEPVVGALLLGLETAGCEITTHVKANIDSGAWVFQLNRLSSSP